MMECDRCLFMFDRNVLPSSSGSRNKWNKQTGSRRHACCMLGLLIDVTL
jgi:hypothetical protein